MRLFVAVGLSAEARAGVLEVQARVKRACGGEGWRARWVPPDAFHLTLKFLGEVPEDRLDVVQGVVAECQPATPFTLTLAGLSTFPGRGRPRVIFLDVLEGREPLVGLASALEAAFENQGFPREARPFHPHLTLARVREAPQHHRDQLEPLRRVEACHTRVAAVTLYRSHLSSAGARYEDVTR